MAGSAGRQGWQEAGRAVRIGRETVTYVATIFKYYVAYQLAVEEMEQRRRPKSQ